MSNYKPIKGYRLHDVRIAYSCGSNSMRSIKYELVDPNNIKGLRDTISEYAAIDNRFLYGNINLNDYIECRSAHDENVDPRGVSFLGLWLKALSLGFIFSKQTHVIPDFKQLVGEKTQGEFAYDGLSDTWKSLIKKESWCNWWKSTGRPAKIENIFDNKLRDGADVKKVIEVYNQNQSLKRDTDFRCRLFGIDRKKVPDESVSLESGVSWSCDPSFPAERFSHIKDRTELIDGIVEYYISKGLDPGKNRKLSNLLGLYGQNQGYMYGFLGNFLTWIKTQDLRRHTKNLSEVFKFNIKEEQVIYERLLELRNYAKEIPEKPYLIDSWAKYCTDFGGTLESWYSNREAKQAEAHSQIERLEKLLSIIREAIRSSDRDEISILDDTLHYIESLGSKISNAESRKLESYLAQLRTELNEWSQQSAENAKVLSRLALDSEDRKYINWQKELGRHIQSSPLFFGESKFSLWGEMYNLKSYIGENTAQMLQVLNDPQYVADDIPEDRYDRLVDSLAQLYNRISVPAKSRANRKLLGSRDILNRLGAIEHLLDTDFSQRDEFHRYAVSIYSNFRNHISKLPCKKIPLAKIIEAADLVPLFSNANKRINEQYFLRDLTQLSKLIVSAKIFNAPSEYQRKIVELHSNLQGYSALLSRRDFIARYAVQAVNGEQSVPAIFMGISKKGNEIKRYGYVFKYVNDGNTTPIIKLSNANPAHTPEEIAEIKELAKSEFVALAVRSSRYQIQFLDWFYGKNKKRSTNLHMGGAFTISEKNVCLDWSGEHPSATVAGEYRLYISQPFTILPIKEHQPLVLEDRFIGVDIGEYGLAWSLIHVSGNLVRQLDSGFISDPQQQKLRQAVVDLRKNQVRQTFSSPDTRISRIRESLIGSYRNQLTELSIRHRARLSFEYEVSAFESGGNRIAKIYDSIKRGIINRPGNEADILMSWGKNPFQKKKNPKEFEQFKLLYGLETTASGTSQFCTRCKRWSSLAIKDNEQYAISELNDGLLSATIANGVVRFLGKEHSEPGETISGKELKKGIYKSMRPNEKGLGMRIVEQSCHDFAKISAIFGQEKPRGNMGVYVCPYTDCHHISDADLQAAFNIAVRGYLKSQWQKQHALRKANANDKLSKEVLCSLEAQLEFDPVPLNTEKAMEMRKSK